MTRSSSLRVIARRIRRVLVVAGLCIAFTGAAEARLAGRIEDTGEAVGVRERLTLTASFMNVRLPDGREFTGYFSRLGLLKPGEEPPVVAVPRNLPPNVTFQPMRYAYELRRQLVTPNGDFMLCSFRYDREGDRFALVGRCSVSTGELVIIRDTGGIR